MYGRNEIGWNRNGGRNETGDGLALKMEALCDLLHIFTIMLKKKKAIGNCSTLLL